MEKELYSFSRLSLFYTCPKAYYYNYIVKLPRGDNIYSFLGGKVHEILEELQTAHITKEEAIRKFNDYVRDCEIFGMYFPTPATEKKYIANIIKYFEMYERIDSDNFFIEEYFETDIGDVRMRGYIDLYVIDGDYIDVYDYKTSSRFNKKDLYVKQIQLIIYGLALQEKHPDKKIRGLYFDMLKYSKNKRGTLKERAEFNSDKKGLVKVAFNEENIKNAKEFIINTYKKINSLNPNIEFEWRANVNNFFCENLCDKLRYCINGRRGF